MMGAMPAVAIRLERRKIEKRLKRPSQLYLGGYPNLRQTTSPGSNTRGSSGGATSGTGASPTPSPLLSPPAKSEDDAYFPEIYVCGKISALHLAVVSLLLGAVILIVGLVQLKPGADAPGHRYYLIAIGCFLCVLGLIITLIRCIVLHWQLKHRRKSRRLARNSQSHQGNTSNTDPKSDSNDLPEPIDQKPVNLKHLYNSTDVMYIDESDRSKTSPAEASVSTIEVLMGAKSHLSFQKQETCSLTMASPTEFDTLLEPMKTPS